MTETLLRLKYSAISLWCTINPCIKPEDVLILLLLTNKFIIHRWLRCNINMGLMEVNRVEEKEQVEVRYTAYTIHQIQPILIATRKSRMQRSIAKGGSRLQFYVSQSNSRSAFWTQGGSRSRTYVRQNKSIRLAFLNFSTYETLCLVNGTQKILEFSRPNILNTGFLDWHYKRSQEKQA